VRSRRTLATLRRELVRREVQAGKDAKLNHVLQTATHLLLAEQAHAREWKLHGSGFAAIEPGLARSVRRVRRARQQALEHPTGEHYHVWRQRVKDLWLQVRLLRARCGGGLAELEEQLEQLDGGLGEYHNCILLEQVLVGHAVVPRRQTAECILLIRGYQKELRGEIKAIVRAMPDEKPSRFVGRVRRLWRRAKSAERPPREGSWRRRAA
jgi:hypothetical protein